MRELYCGVLPNELTYGLRIINNIDMSMMQYNTYYKSHDFMLSKFPDGFDTLPGYELMLDRMLEGILSPSQEIERINNNSINYYDNLINNQ